MQSPSTTICIRIIALWRSTPVLGTKHQPKVLDILEVFNPKTQVVTPGADFGSYNNDAVALFSSGFKHDKPLFLKAAYNGPAATEEIASYDPETDFWNFGQCWHNRNCLELIRRRKIWSSCGPLWSEDLLCRRLH